MLSLLEQILVSTLPQWPPLGQMHKMPWVPWMDWTTFTPLSSLHVLFFLPGHLLQFWPSVPHPRLLFHLHLTHCYCLSFNDPISCQQQAFTEFPGRGSILFDHTFSQYIIALIPYFITWYLSTSLDISSMGTKNCLSLQFPVASTVPDPRAGVQ